MKHQIEEWRVGVKAAALAEAAGWRRRGARTDWEKYLAALEYLYEGGKWELSEGTGSDCVKALAKFLYDWRGKRRRGGRDHANLIEAARELAGTLIRASPVINGNGRRLRRHPRPIKPGNKRKPKPKAVPKEKYAALRDYWLKQHGLK